MNSPRTNDKIDLIVIPSGHVITVDLIVEGVDKNNDIEEYDSEDYEYYYNLENDSFEYDDYLDDHNLDDYLDDYLDNFN
ncbi:hypothetical protein KM1_102010 [Entamoeba histolytica HM-3:IMSS]|uniref:Uncharacterized protein n=1 Tax=Entamoeba histolytica HM-3:IMSS TaxID=885315 RepID=M7W6P9_ENTHI|nr:hypothetical protein KM1_102010 [Entamoeba histolytica HM-3:IMSS]